MIVEFVSDMLANERERQSVDQLIHSFHDGALSPSCIYTSLDERSRMRTCALPRPRQLEQAAPMSEGIQKAFGFALLAFGCWIRIALEEAMWIQARTVQPSCRVGHAGRMPLLGFGSV